MNCIELYGYDSEGPSPPEEDHSIVVKEITLEYRHSIESYVLDVVDPLTQFTQQGTDIYVLALDLVRDKMDLANE